MMLRTLHEDGRTTLLSVVSEHGKLFRSMKSVSMLLQFIQRQRLLQAIILLWSLRLGAVALPAKLLTIQQPCRQTFNIILAKAAALRMGQADATRRCA